MQMCGPLISLRIACKGDIKQESGQWGTALLEKMNWLELPRIVGFDTRVEFAGMVTAVSASSCPRQV